MCAGRYFVTSFSLFFCVWKKAYSRILALVKMLLNNLSGDLETISNFATMKKGTSASVWAKNFPSRQSFKVIGSYTCYERCSSEE
jgi:hypothetical protein